MQCLKRGLYLKFNCTRQEETNVHVFWLKASYSEMSSTTSYKSLFMSATALTQQRAQESGYTDCITWAWLGLCHAVLKLLEHYTEPGNLGQPFLTGEMHASLSDSLKGKGDFLNLRRPQFSFPLTQ